MTFSDAAGAVANLADSPATPPAPTLRHGLDVFHTTMEVRRVLARRWRIAEATWARAEAVEPSVAEVERRGLDAWSVAQSARAARTRAVASMEQVEWLESAWGRARAVFDLFGPDGRINDRCPAEAAIASAVTGLKGPDWAKVRNALADRRCLAFLDRMHRRLEAAEPRREWREAMAWLWWLLHRRPPSAGPVTGLVRAAGRGRELGEEEPASSEGVSAVLRDTLRASCVKECMNSVLRMQQSRHKRMTQPMIDLKRLYWNCHPFGSGPRKGASPYRALGRNKPTFDFWTLLQFGPGELTLRLSITRNEE